MTYTQALEALINEAIDGGWFTTDYSGTPADIARWASKGKHYMQIIFDQDFASALWGEGKCQTGALRHGDIEYMVDWQYHLQQMVLADDPVSYAYEIVFMKVKQ